jgi:hypothetical protein
MFKLNGTETWSTQVPTCLTCSGNVIDEITVPGNNPAHIYTNESVWSLVYGVHFKIISNDNNYKDYEPHFIGTSNNLDNTHMIYKGIRTVSRDAGYINATEINYTGSPVDVFLQAPSVSGGSNPIKYYMIPGSIGQLGSNTYGIRATTASGYAYNYQESENFIKIPGIGCWYFGWTIEGEHDYMPTRYIHHWDNRHIGEGYMSQDPDTFYRNDGTGVSIEHIQRCIVYRFPDAIEGITYDGTPHVLIT